VLEPDDTASPCVTVWRTPGRHPVLVGSGSGLAGPARGARRL